MKLISLSLTSIVLGLQSSPAAGVDSSQISLRPTYRTVLEFANRNSRVLHKAAAKFEGRSLVFAHKKEHGSYLQHHEHLVHFGNEKLLISEESPSLPPHAHGHDLSQFYRGPSPPR